MGSIPLPALDIKAPPQTDPLASLGKVVQMKTLLQGQQLQQGQLQLQQQQIKDQQAVTDAMKTWDGKDYDALKTSVLKNGGSANAALAVEQHGLGIKKTVSDIAATDATTGSKNLETYIGAHKAVGDAITGLKAVPDEQLHDAAIAKVNDLAQGGIMDPKTAQGLTQQIQGIQDPAALRAQLDSFGKLSLGAKAVAEQAKTEAEGAHAAAQAGLAELKLKLQKDSKPGDFDAQIDALIPKGAVLNQQTKVLVNGALQRGDFESAQKAIEHAGNFLNEMAKDKYSQDREDMRSALNRQAGQSNQLQKNGLEQLDKMFTDPQHGYTQFLAQANATKATIASAKNGSELAASLAPLMTVLGVNSFAGVHRINPAEYQAAGPALGSLYRRVNAALDKAATGSLTPDTMKEMDGLVDGLIGQKHASMIPGAQMVAQNAGLDPAKTMVMGKDGKMDTLANVSAPPQYAKDPQGKLHSAPAGVPLPAGWTKVEAPQ